MKRRRWPSAHRTHGLPSAPRARFRTPHIRISEALIIGRVVPKSKWEPRRAPLVWRRGTGSRPSHGTARWPGGAMMPVPSSRERGRVGLRWPRACVEVRAAGSGTSRQGLKTEEPLGVGLEQRLLLGGVDRETVVCDDLVDDVLVRKVHRVEDA